MDLSRRRFLGCAAAGVAGLALPAGLRRRVGPPPDESRVACAIVDLRDQCAMRESLAGYESALAGTGTAYVRAAAESLPRCNVVIVPAALAIPPALADAMSAALREGATVILESGAGFADEASPDFRAHRDALRDRFGIHAGAPVPLWPRHPSSGGIPYVDYTWPSAARVRDFSRLVPLTAPQGDAAIIARVDGMPAAIRRRIGRGTLVVLGSPLGVALWAGDGEGARWLLRARERV